MYLLGIDVGTSGCKIVLTDEAGAILAKAYHEYPLSVPRPGWSEQNPEDWYQAACAGIRDVLAGRKGSEVAGLAVSGMMATLVVLDERGEVIRPAILWNDQRSTAQAEGVTAALGLETVLRHTANVIFPSFFAPKILWMKEHEPEHYQKIRWVLFPKDYLVYRLTGRLVTDVTDMSGSCLYDVKARQYAEEMCRAFSVRREWLPECVESQTAVGTVSAAAAADTGLSRQTTVAAGGGDQACQALGSGIVRPGMCGVTVGTSGVVLVNSDTFRMQEQGRLHAFCHAVRGQWYMMGVMLSAGGSYQWLRNLLRTHEPALDYDRMNALAAASPAGSRGLFFLPYLCGERCPHNDAYARGVFFGLSASHGSGDMIRAVMEGITYGLLDCFDMIRDSGCTVDRVYVSGGASNSALWMGMIADMFGVPTVQNSAPEAGALGAVLLAGAACGAFPDVMQAAERITGTGREFLPRPENTARYAEGHAIYGRLYERLKDTFADAAALQGG